MTLVTLFRMYIGILVAISFVLISACAKQPSKTAFVEKPPETKQEVTVESKVVPEQPVAVAKEKPAGEAKVTPTIVAEVKPEKKEEVKQEAAEKKEEIIVTPKRKVALKDYHTVKKGECLWWIAKYKDVYNDPYLWPLIYEANKKSIAKPNLIYPGQRFTIPRKGYSMKQIQQIRKSAGAPKPYTPPKEAHAPLN